MWLSRALFSFLILAEALSAAFGAGPGYPACKDRGVMARAIELMDESDDLASQRLIQRGMKNKECKIIPAGELVIETTPPLSRLVKAHRRGDPDEYWIIR
ncbi:MAG: hypothetical protein ACR652_07525 [Methylocystis sp.]|uniref:hypothetical protein n=1 Tax=Methylocystis sp. TaxID=1911079 RepID=UPI003DA4DA4C